MNAVASRNIKFVSHSRPGRPRRRRPDHGASRLRLCRPRVQQRHHDRRRARSEAPEGRRLHRLPARHARLSPADPRRPAAGGQRAERLDHAGIPEREGLFRRLAGGQAEGSSEPVHRRHPGLRHLQAREAGRDRLHAGRRPRTAPHLVHGRPLRLCLHPLRRFHRPHPRGHRHVRPAQARGRRPLVASRHVARAAARRRPGATGKRYALHHALVAGNLAYAAWRDGGLTVLDVADPTQAEAAVPSQHRPAVRRRHALAAAAAGSQSARPRATSRPPPTAARGCATSGCSTSASPAIRSASRPSRSPPRRTTAPRAAASARTTCTRTGPARSRARA